MRLEQAFKTACGDARVPHGHGGVSVAQVILHCAQVGALVRKGVTTRMAQARFRLTSLHLSLIASVTRNPCWYIIISSRWSRTPCRPVLAAASSRSISS